MSICKQEAKTKIGCKQEDVNANPPVLKSNNIPDKNGITHHNPLLCEDTFEPVISKLPNKKQKANHKIKTSVLSDIHESNLQDKLREITSFFWETKNNQLQHVRTQAKTNNPNLELREQFKVTIQDETNKNNSDFKPSREAKIKIVGLPIATNRKPSHFSKDDAEIEVFQGSPYETLDSFYETLDSFKKRVLRRIDTKKVYQDFVWDGFLPFDEDDFEKFTFFDNDKFVGKGKFDYNFYHEKYEKLLLDSKLDEKILPSLNIWQSERNNRVRNRSVNDFYNFINLNGLLQKKDFKKIYPDTSIFQKLSSQQRQYLDEYVENVLDLSEEDRELLGKKFTNQMLIGDDSGLVKEVKDIKAIFPFVVDVQFPNDSAFVLRSNLFLKALVDNKLDASLLNFVVQTDKQKEFKEEEMEESKDSEILSSFEKYVNRYTGINVRREFVEQTQVKTESGFVNFLETKKRKTWNITKWIELFNKFEVQEEVLENKNALEIFDTKKLNIASFLGSHPSDIENLNKESYEYFKKLMFLMFSAKTKEIQKRHFRTISEMFEFGEKCYNEQLFFRIEKKKTENPPTIQNFYITNSTTDSIMSWLDSQVKYNSDYHYNVYVYTIVLGTEYDYKNAVSYANITTSPDVTDQRKEIVFPGVSIPQKEQDPFARPRNTPNIEKKQKTTEREVSRPIDPNEKLRAPILELTVNYKPSFMLVEQPYFSVSGGILDSPPVQPEIEFVPFVGVNNKIQINVRSSSGESLEIPIMMNGEEELYKFYERDEKGQIKFKNDDLVSSFEVGRILDVPKSYNDFSGKLRVIKSKVNAPAVSFFDDMRTNTKYYYVFRSIDNHGHKSNPTSIYEVELINDGGFTYLDVKLFEFPILNQKSKIKDVGKYLKIMPTFSQTMIKNDNSSVPVVGLESESILEKNFKLRITSKKTGKKVDINFSYRHEHET